MAWGSISLFAGFLEKENSLRTLIVIFENVSLKGFFVTEYEEFRNFHLTASSRYLQTAALKGSNYFYELKGNLRPVMHKYFMTVLKISTYLQGFVLKTMQA